jgi:uncharacterized membrane protein YidH (DUF202 family)
MQHNPYTAPVGAPMGQPLATGQYEFTSLEEQQISQTGTRARIWGFIAIALGVVICIFAAVILAAGVSLPGPLAAVAATAAIALGPMGVVYFVIGWFYISAGARLAAVAQTQGNDVEHLMQGLDKMASAIRIEVILTIVGFVIGFVLGVVNAM